MLSQDLIAFRMVAKTNTLLGLVEFAVVGSTGDMQEKVQNKLGTPLLDMFWQSYAVVVAVVGREQEFWE